MPKLPVLVLALMLPAITAGAQTLPPGPAADVLKARCVVCHEADIITSQRLTLIGWTRSLDKMVRWGAGITPEEREILQPYLATFFGPKPVASHAASEDGSAILKRACLSCHQTDIVEQQRLSSAAWTRSVEKMMRWGAALSEAEKLTLVEYLTSRFGPP